MPSPTARPSNTTRKQRTPTTAIIAVLSAAFVLFSTACERRRDYDQSTPDDVVRSAVEMVRNTDAQRLPDLIYAETPTMRAALNRLGNVLASLQDLADAIAEHMPEDAARLAELAQERVEGAGGPAAALAPFFNRGGSRGDGRSREEREAAFRDSVAQLFADPYGWIDRGAERLSTMDINDELAAVTFDDRPVFPPVGVNLRLVDGRWFVSLPTNLPPISNFMPRTREEWSVIVSFMTVLESTVDELAEDVRAGRIRQTKKLSDEAWGKLAFPGVMVFTAYSNMMDVRQRTERRISAYNAAARRWRSDLTERFGRQEGRLPRDVRETMRKVATERIQRLTEQREQVGFPEDMSAPAFERRMTDWLDDAGVAIDLTGDFEPEAWEATAAAYLAEIESQANRRTRRDG